MPGAAKHSKKWDDCVSDIKAKGGPYDPYAVCTAVLDGKEVSEKELEKALEALGSSSNGPVLRGKAKSQEKTHKPKKPHGDPLKPAKPKKPKSSLFDGKKPKKADKPTAAGKPHVHHIHKRKKIESASLRESLFRISEATQDDDGRLFFPVVIIAEGLGNLRDRNYYLPTAIQSGVKVYEGAQAYYDHPSPQEEQQQPNRTINELLGHYEQCKAVKGDSGLLELQARLYVIEGISRADAQDVLKHAVIYAKKFPDKNFIGLSINGDGEGETVDYNEFCEKYDPPPKCLEKLKQIEGQDINAINKLTDAFSADVVTAAGAGGKVKTQEGKERVMKFKEHFKKFWSAVERNDFDAAEKAMSKLTEGESEHDKEKKEAADKEDSGVKKMLQAMKQWQKQNEKKEKETEHEYEARMEAGVKDMLQAEAEKEKKEAKDKDCESDKEKKEKKDESEHEKEKKESEDDDDSDDDKKKAPPKKGDDDKDGDDDGDDTDESDKEKKESESEDDDDSDDSDDDDKDHADAGKDKKLIAKMMKKHMSMAKQMQAMNEKMEKMSAEMEKHEKESKQAKKEAAEAKTSLAIKAREELIDAELSKSGFPMRVTKLWRPALEGCRSEKEIRETIKSLVEAAAQANAERFYVEGSRGLVEKEATEGTTNNSDLFLK